MPRIKLFIQCCLLVCAVSQLSAQMNVKIGYNPVIGSFSGVNQIQQAYAPSTGVVQSGFNDLAFMHGIQLGLRQRFGNLGIELGWESLTSSKSALTFNDTNESFTTRSYNHDIKTWSFALDQYLSPVGFGSAISRTNYSIAREVGTNEISIVNESNYGVRVHLNWVIQESNLVSLVIRPYYQFYLNDVDLTAFAADLNSSITATESLSFFGLSFIFYNGRQ